MKKMKPILKSLLLVLGLVSLILIQSCGGSDNETDTVTTATNDNFIKARVDGVDYSVTGTAITGDQNSLAFNFRSDISGGGTGMDFSINGQAAVGTYTLNYSNATANGRLNYRLNGDIYSSAICSSSGGILTITAKNGKTIEGTFSFTGKKILGCDAAAKSVTAGSFKVTFL